MIGPELRASDDDRRRVVHELERHTAAGRLSLDEYTERVDRALTARTHGQLAEVTGDLPAETVEPAPVVDRHAAGARQLGLAFLVALLALGVIGLLVAIGR